MLFSTTSLGGIFCAIRNANKSTLLFSRMNTKTFIALMDITERNKATLTSIC